MKRPTHIPKKAWDKAQELLTTAPALWVRGICAGRYISNDEDDYDEDFYDNEEEDGYEGF